MRIIFVLWISLLLFSCKEENQYVPIPQNEFTLNLKFNAFETATNQQAKIGLSWALAQIGAIRSGINDGGIFQNNNVFTIDLNLIELPTETKESLLVLHQKIKETQEYQINNNIDLGRYVSLLIGSSNHYNKLVQIPDTLNAILSNYTLLQDKGYVNNSAVSSAHRIIEYSKQDDFNQLYLSAEIAPNSSQILEYETIEIMENGHLKYGIFDVNGNRKNQSNSSITEAGKPAKCMWCHESKISRLFTEQEDVPGFIPYLQFKDTLRDNYTLHRIKQNGLDQGVDFTQEQDHVNMELLYISFMEPSAQVLSEEWDLTEAEVLNRLSNLETHVYEEFPFLGDLYHREEVKNFAPFSSLQVSSSVREESLIEVDHLD